MAFCPSCGNAVEGRYCPKCGTAVDPAAPSAGPAQVINASGLPENTAAALCYLFGLVTGIIFLVLEPYSKNKLIRFHAFQSIIVFATLNVAYYAFWFVPVFGWIINSLLAALVFILWIVSMFRAYHGEKWKVPVAGILAEKWANR